MYFLIPQKMCQQKLALVNAVAIDQRTQYYHVFIPCNRTCTAFRSARNQCKKRYWKTLTAVIRKQSKTKSNTKKLFSHVLKKKLQTIFLIEAKRKCLSLQMELKLCHPRQIFTMNVVSNSKFDDKSQPKYELSPHWTQTLRYLYRLWKFPDL